MRPAAVRVLCAAAVVAVVAMIMPAPTSAVPAFAPLAATAAESSSNFTEAPALSVSESAPFGGLVDSTVGQLISEDMSCTSTMVNSPTGRVAVTAAHCVYVPQRHDHLGEFYAGLEPGWRSGMLFVPGRSGDRAPFGAWNVTYAWIDRQWQEHADLAFDVAFIELADREGRTAQQELGAQGIGFDARVPPRDVAVLGYPTMPPFDGTRMHICTSEVAKGPPGDSGAVEMACDLTGGASGGPWLAGLTEAGMGTVVGVSSFKPFDRPGRVAGIPLGRAAHELWRAAARAP